MGKISLEKLNTKLEARNLEITKVYILDKFPVLIKINPGIFVFCDSKKEWNEYPDRKNVRSCSYKTRTFALLEEFVTSKNFVLSSEDKLYVGLNDKILTFLSGEEEGEETFKLDFVDGMIEDKEVVINKERSFVIFPCYRWSDFSKMIDNPLQERIQKDIEEVTRDFSDYISEKYDQECEKLYESLKKEKNFDRLLLLQNLLEIEKSFY